jgi:hypothetical protein
LDAAVRDDERRQVDSWAEQLRRTGSVTLGLSRRYQLTFGLGGVLFVALGALFFARDGWGLTRILAGAATLWGVVMILIPTLPWLRRRFEIVVDGTGIQTPGPLVPWVDLHDVIVGSISGREAVLLEVKPAGLSGESPALTPGQGIYLPYTLPATPTALATWLAEEGRARGRGRSGA